MRVCLYMFLFRPSPQYRPEEDVELDVRYRLKFSQLSLNRPAAQEKEGMQKNLWPQESRTRNLTYSSSLFVSIEQTTYKIDPLTNEEVYHSYTNKYIYKYNICMHGLGVKVLLGLFLLLELLL